MINEEGWAFKNIKSGELQFSPRNGDAVFRVELVEYSRWMMGTDKKIKIFNLRPELAYLKESEEL